MAYITFYNQPTISLNEKIEREIDLETDEIIGI